MHMKATNGHISLVGAGPGDPELITLKGVQALQQSEVVFYDALVNEALLEHAQQAVKYFVGKRGGERSFPQEDINQLLVNTALEGKRVVRLKGGDVSVFARAAEELQYIQLFNIPTVVIPGISCYSGIAAQHQVPLTKRCEFESFWVTTGHTCKGTISKDMDLAAQSSATVVILMGMQKLIEIVEVFKKYKPCKYPLAIVQHGTTPQERSIVGNLSNIVELVHEHRIGSPAVIFIGEAAIDPTTTYKNLQAEAALTM